MNVFEQQSILKELGYYKSPVDGISGPRTRAAQSAYLMAYGIKFGVDHPRLMIAAEQMIMKRVGGLEVGPVDGYMGSKTQAARDRWNAMNWRDRLTKADVGDNRMPAPVRTTWPTQSQMAAFYGKPGENLVTFTVPYKLKLAWDHKTTVGKITANKKVKESTERVLARVLDVYGLDGIVSLGLDLYGGTYNNRVMRGGTTLSTHAYGAAHDFDPERNQLNWNRTKANFAKPEYEAWWDAWTDEGWLSLGKARDFDWMHVQAARLG